MHDHYPHGVTVYNFEVEGDHTYFVGTANGGAWVHNDCGPELKELYHYTKGVYAQSIMDSGQINGGGFGAWRWRSGDVELLCCLVLIKNARETRIMLGHCRTEAQRQWFGAFETPCQLYHERILTFLRNGGSTDEVGDGGLVR